MNAEPKQSPETRHQTHSLPDSWVRVPTTQGEVCFACFLASLETWIELFRALTLLTAQSTVHREPSESPITLDI